MKTHPKRGRAWAYAGAILGGAVSVAANVAHSFIPPHNAPATWSPEPGAVVGAIVWPIFLFIAVEILVRVMWPAGRGWALLKFCGLLPVAAVAAFVSYKHLSGLLAHYGEEPVVYLLGPIAVDGLMLMATGALMAINHRNRPTPAPAAAVSVSAPAPVPASAPTSAAVNPAPVPVPVPAPAAPAPVSAVDTPTTSAPVPAPRVERPSSDPVPVAAPKTGATLNQGESATTIPASSRPAQASPAPSRTHPPVTALNAATPAQLPVPAALLTRAQHVATAHRDATGNPITAGELAVRMRVNTDVASQLLAVLDLRPDSPTTPIAALNGSAVSGVSR